jgi:hypothetical protein
MTKMSGGRSKIRQDAAAWHVPLRRKPHSCASETLSIEELSGKADANAGRSYNRSALKCRTADRADFAD